MKLILYNAVSLDGFIATTSGDSDWALDGEEFEKFAGKIGCILIGRKTFEQYQGDIYPLTNAVNFVYSSEPKKYNRLEDNQVKFIGGSTHVVLNQIKREGFDTVLLAGGSETNCAFAQAGLIDEMILDVHPLLLGEGMPLLGSYTKTLNLTLLSSHNNPNGFIQNHYTVL